MKIIPAHTRTIYIAKPHLLWPDEYNESHSVYKFKLNIPDMVLEKKYDESKACHWKYYPIINGDPCYSPFLNTYDNQSICLSEVATGNYDQTLQKIYSTSWQWNCFCDSIFQYVGNHNIWQDYLKFVKNWEKTGVIKLKKIDPLKEIINKYVQ